MCTLVATRQRNRAKRHRRRRAASWAISAASDEKAWCAVSTNVRPGGVCRRGEPRPAGPHPPTVPRPPPGHVAPRSLLQQLQGSRAGAEVSPQVRPTRPIHSPFIPHLRSLGWRSAACGDLVLRQLPLVPFGCSLAVVGQGLPHTLYD